MEKKKLLLISAIILLAGIESYGKTIWVDGTTKDITQEEVDTNKAENDTTVISVKNSGNGTIKDDVTINIENNNTFVKKILNIASGGSATNNGTLIGSSGTNGVEIVSIQNGDFINNGTIDVSGNKSIGINITGGNIKVENNGKIIANSGAVGVSLTNSSSTFINNSNGIINVSGSGTKGIYVGSGTGENNGEIIVAEKAIGINVNGKDAVFNNKDGKILVTGSGTTGAAIWNGKLNNSGNIVVNNAATGIDVNGSSANFENQTEGKIFVSGQNSKGIQLRENGEAWNNGTIEVIDKGIGIYFAGEGTFTNKGTIYSAESGSKGIYLNSEGTASNEGNIIVGQDYKDKEGNIISGAGAEGVNVNKEKSEFINKESGLIKVTGVNSKGISMANGTASNEGRIEVDSKASGVYLNGENGKFINEKTGKILVDGKDSKGIYISKGNATNNGIIQVINGGNGVFFSGKGTFVNEKDANLNVYGSDSKGIFLNGGDGTAYNNGNINLVDGSVGVYNKGGNVINTGEILGEGTGVKLENGYFINSGKISTTGNAIESIKDSNNTVYLKDGSEINGKVVGGEGIDILAVNGIQNNLDVDKYEAIVVRNGDTTISDSKIALEYNKGTNEYLEESKNKLDQIEDSTSSKTPNSNGNLTLKNSKLVIDFKDSLTNPNATENPIIDANELIFEGKTNLVFNSSDGRNEFNLNEALGLEGKEINLDDAKLEKTAVWEYEEKDGNLIARKQNYEDVVTKGQLKDFATVFDQNRSSMSGDFFNDVVAELDTLKTADEFTNAMAQMSGGIHGYTVDMAAINSRTLVNTMKNKIMTRDYITDRPLNSWIQDVVYLDNNHRMDGLMSASYNENGILGVSEKQVFSNGRLGFIYGGSKGEAKFDGGESGNISSTNTYLGGYYSHNFNDNLTLNSNFSFVYGHNKVNRKINIGDFNSELKSNYPTFAMGVGTNLIYTIKDEEKNKLSFYTGIDINRIMQGNINENEEIRIGDSNANLMIKNPSANEFSYYSITPNVGFMLQNSGYIFDKKYQIGTDFSWETELGNIKDGKRLNMHGISEQYKVGTIERENIISASVFGQVDLTESLALTGKYTASMSDEYDADMLTLGMSYKFDTLADNLVIGPMLQEIENYKVSSISDRWTGTFAFMFENEDDSDRAYYHVEDKKLIGGDYATSMKMKPKFILNLRDKQSQWSYYFEGYYMANDFLKETKDNEEEQSSSRLHGEARWTNSYSKGKYGINIGYRHETEDKPTLTTYPDPQRIESATHQLRLTPNFTYKLGKGFSLDIKTTGIFEYNYTGIREGQMDFLMENEHYLIYTGFMPNWTLRLGYYREDKWMDHSNKKLSWDKVSKEVVEISDVERYQMNQLRPSVTYYFGNGDRITLSFRIPLGNGGWYNSLDNNKKSAESYETRYSVDYTHLVTPGFNVFGGITFLDMKLKNKDHSSSDYGKITRSYSFRPTLGFSYNF